MHVLYSVRASPSLSFLSGLGKKADAIIHLQYLKEGREGGVCRTGEGMYLLMAEKGEMAASGLVKDSGRNTEAEMS